MKIHEYGKEYLEYGSKNSLKNQKFDNWLLSPTGQDSGDEYYWHHQQDLLHSSLQFHGNISSQSTAVVIDLSREMEFKQTAHHALKDLENFPISSETEIGSSPLHISNPPKIETNISGIKKDLLNLFATHGLSTKNIDLHSKTNAPARPNRIALTWKNYHIYWDDQHCEISLNDSKLSPKHKEEVIQILKQWFKKNGIAIQQFIINGVQQ